MPFDPRVAEDKFAYLTTTGRRTGQPREIEIWFVLSADGATVYVMAGEGERSNWLRNLRDAPAVSVRIGQVTLAGRAEVLEPGEEDETARDRLVRKYRTSHGDLEGWRRNGLPVAVRV